MTTSPYWQRWLPDAPAVAAVGIVHGAAEHGGRYPRLVASRRLIGCCGSQDKTLNVYAATGHDVFNEPAGERAAADVAAWVTARSGMEET